MLLNGTHYANYANADTVLVFGDSISAAYGIQREQGWVALLGARFDLLEMPHQVVNASISGETTGGGLARLNKLLEASSPDIVILELGGNDGLRGYPIERIQENMQSMLDMAHASGAQVLILGMRIPPNYGVRYAEAFHNIYQTLAKEEGTALLPFFMQGIAEQPALMQADRVHPGAKAQTLLLDNVWPLLSELFSKHD